ncbi:V-set domain-containing T-cell activation inhibitor 1 [Colossoma macropomum]|uniref:V-set domain-containing T-cell activation inhibitor 1 n=1 Tax=Colossoma macropomum TaxID=42526 RepID=UPI0018651A79|nr:V-set domain-containing T-cell activation inhibitor 1 [Colossoma macropomum]
MHLRDFLNQSVSYTLVGVYTLLWILSCVQSKTPDVDVTCIYSEDCILPCSFPPTDDVVVIQWYQQEKLIYSFQQGEDEPDDSSMSLFTDEVSKGNASLLLKDSRIQSRGRYRCLINATKTVKESFVIVKVEAPISRISIEASPTGQIQCSSHGLYPAPVLTWSTNPSIGNLRSLIRMSPDSNGLYSVESTLQKVNKSTPLTYICTITSKYSSQSWKASLLQTEMVGKIGHELIIPCLAPKNLKNFTLTWTFAKRNKNKDILTYHSQSHKVINQWKEEAELDLEKARTGDGSLYLDDHEVSKHAGKYTCTFSGPRVTYIVQTSVSVSSSSAAAQKENSKSKLWVLAVVVAALTVLGVLYYLYRKYIGNSKALEEDTEMQAVKGKTPEEVPAEISPLNGKGDS